MGLSKDIAQRIEDFSISASLPKTAAPEEAIEFSMDTSSPKYLIENIFGQGMNPLAFDGPTMIGDWNDAFFSYDSPPRTAICGPYMTPEFNSPKHLSTASDIWMLGCSIFQFVTGRDLFGRKSDPAEKILSAMMDILGTPPKHLFEDWASFLADRGQILVMKEQPRSIEHHLYEVIPTFNQDITRGELDYVIALLRVMLVYEPSKRPTIDQIFEYPAMKLFY